MPETKSTRGSEALARAVGAIRARHPTVVPDLLDEVEELGRIIANAKAEIAALVVDDIAICDIPFAADELDAIVAHTASATNVILESCEMLDTMIGGLDETEAARLREATTRIYEACSFQDITGQRITKVVATLKAIEQKVAQIVATFGARVPGERDRRTAESAPLLSGPQLPASAMAQAEIDQLLASLD